MEKTKGENKLLSARKKKSLKYEGNDTKITANFPYKTGEKV